MYSLPISGGEVLQVPARPTLLDDQPAIYVVALAFSEGPLDLSSAFDPQTGRARSPASEPAAAGGTSPRLELAEKLLGWRANSLIHSGNARRAESYGLLRRPGEPGLIAVSLEQHDCARRTTLQSRTRDVEATSE